MKASKPSGAKRRDLPTTANELIALCKKLGWTATEGTRGTRVSPPDSPDAVVIPGRLNGGRTGDNVHAGLRRIGIDAALAEWEADQEARRQERLAPPPPPKARVKPVNPAFVAPTTPQEPHVAKVATVTPRSQAGSGMYTEEFDVTPEMAEEWLARPLPTLADGTVIRQRPRRPAYSLLLAEAMEAGEFLVTSQGVALAPTEGNTGGVLDGQHRLEAIIAHGKPVKMRVTFNVPPETFAVMDTGKARSPADVLYMLGESNTHKLGSVAKLVDVWQQWQQDPTGPLKDWANWHRVKVPNPHLVSLVRRWPTLSDHMRTASTFVGPPIRINLPAVTVHRLWAADRWPACAEPSGDEPSILDEWYDKLRHGYGPEFADQYHPLVQTRNWLQSGGPRRSSHYAAREATLVALIKGWNGTFHRKNDDGTFGYRQLKLLRIKVTDLMPVPVKY